MTLGRALLDSGDLDAAMAGFEAVLQELPTTCWHGASWKSAPHARSEPELVAAEDAPAAPAVAAAPVAVATPPAPAPVSDGPVGVVSVAMEAPRFGKTAADLTPIPVVAAEALGAGRALRVAAPARPAAPPPPPPSAPVDGHRRGGAVRHG